MENNELQHWGILGMKWGRRRYQNKDGSLTPEGKKRYADPPSEDDPDYETKKKQILKSGSAEDVMRYQGKLTNQELRDAVDRIRNESALKEIMNKDAKTAFDKAQSVMDKVGKVTDMANKGIGAYNVVAKVNNAFNSNFDLPTIEGGDSRRTREEKSLRERFIREATPEQVARRYSDLSVKELEEIVRRMNYQDSIDRRRNQTQ